MNKREEDKFGKLIANLTPDRLVDLLQFARVLLARQRIRKHGPTARRWARLPEEKRQKIFEMVMQEAEKNQGQ